MIQIQDLVKRFGTTEAVNIGQLHITQGQCVGLVGNNGAGKTTLLRLITDLLPANSGQVLIGGIRVDQSEDWKSLAGCYIDHGFLINYLTPKEYFEFIGSCHQLSKDETEQRLEPYRELLDEVLTAKRKTIGAFSEGNKQKIGIVGAMILKPRLLLLDEPFNYLDPSSQAAMCRLIRQLHEEGTTALVSSHNLEYITEVSTRILLMDHGSIVKDLDNQNGGALAELKAWFD